MMIIVNNGIYKNLSPVKFTFFELRFFGLAGQYTAIYFRAIYKILGIFYVRTRRPIWIEFLRKVVYYITVADLRRGRWGGQGVILPLSDAKKGHSHKKRVNFRMVDIS